MQLQSSDMLRLHRMLWHVDLDRLLTRESYSARIRVYQPVAGGSFDWPSPVTPKVIFEL